MGVSLIGSHQRDYPECPEAGEAFGINDVPELPSGWTWIAFYQDQQQDGYIDKALMCPRHATQVATYFGKDLEAGL